MSVFKCLDVCNSLAVLPTCAIPCAYVFCKRVTERSETMISVAWNFSVMWDRTTTQTGMQGLMAETPLQGAGVHSSSSQTCTTEVSEEKAQLTGQGFCASLSQKCPFRWGVPSRGWLPPAQHTGALGEGCLQNSWITSDISRGSDKTGCTWNLGMVFRPHHLSAAWT